MSIPRAQVQVILAPSPNADGSVNITLSTDGSALYITLVTLAQGRFSDNAFHMWGPGGTRVVQFLPWGPLDYEALQSSLRVDHVRAYF